jgi:hypothetical protein
MSVAVIRNCSGLKIDIIKFVAVNSENTVVDNIRGGYGLVT